MKMEKLKLPALVLSIGLVVAVVACLFTNAIIVPTVTEHEFNYSVTYKLDGEVKTFEGSYVCRFDGEDNLVDPTYRYYEGEYTDYGLAVHSGSYTIAQKDGVDLGIVTIFNDSYLMGDTKNEYYDDTIEEPFLMVYDRDGVGYEESELFDLFDVEIVSWEYPEPVKNSFVFAGFSLLHEGSLYAALLVGILVIVACIIFVRKDKDVSYKLLDKISIVLNGLVVLGALPIITTIVLLLGLTAGGDEVGYQLYLALPAVTAFTVAASIALRRRGFTKSGFFIQFVGPVAFGLVTVLEVILFYM